MITTDLCILVAYPNGASGKFLLNCLCMNEEFVPLINYNDYIKFKNENDQQAFLLEKLRYFINAFPNEFEWRDLDMGEWCFTENPIVKYADLFIARNCSNISQYNYNLQTLRDVYRVPLIQAVKNSIFYKTIQEKSKYFFRTIHNQLQYDFYNEIFKTKNCIQIVNSQKWISKRNSNVNAVNKYSLDSNFKDIKSSFQFDCDAFLHRDYFIEEYLRLLDNMSCVKKNTDRVLQFYDLYVPYILGPTNL